MGLKFFIWGVYIAWQHKINWLHGRGLLGSVVFSSSPYLALKSDCLEIGLCVVKAPGFPMRLVCSLLSLKRQLFRICTPSRIHHRIRSPRSAASGP